MKRLIVLELILLLTSHGIAATQTPNWNEAQWALDPEKMRFVEEELLPIFDDTASSMMDKLPALTDELNQIIKDPEDDELELHNMKQFTQQSEQKLKRLRKVCEKARWKLGKRIADIYFCEGV